MIKRIALLAIILALSLSTPVMAADPGNGTIEGQVINGTSGGSDISNHDITLKIYVNNQETDSANTKTDEEGRFTFEGLSTDATHTYELFIIYETVEYYSEPLIFEGDEISISAEMVVYDTTPSDEAVKVMTSHTIMRFDADGSLWITEYYLFVNDSDRAYVGAVEVPSLQKNETLRFILPENASEFQAEYGLMDCCVASIKDGFVDTMAVTPGAREIIYSYKAGYKSGAYDFYRNINYPTYNYDLLVQGTEATIASDQLATQETLDIQGTVYRHLSGSGLARGDTMLARISGLPETGSQGSLKWVAIALIALIAGFIFFNMRRKMLQPAKAKVGADREDLLAEIAQLDDDYESGKINEPAYRQLRAEKKAQLVSLTQQAKGKNGNL